MPGWCVIQHRKNICKFAFENLRFEIAYAYQSLLRTCFAAMAIKRASTFTRMLHDDCDIVVIYMKRKWVTSDSVISMLLHWYCQIVFCCDIIIQFALKSFNISGGITPCVLHRTISLSQHMMTSSNRDIFRVTGHLCEEFTGHRWIPRTKASDAELWCFRWSVSE